MIFVDDEYIEVIIEKLVFFEHLVVVRQNQVVPDLYHIVVIVKMTVHECVTSRLQPVNKRLKLNWLLKYGLSRSKVEYLEIVTVLTLRNPALLQVFVQDDESIGSLIDIESFDLVDGAEFCIGCRQLKLAEIDIYIHNCLTGELFLRDTYLVTHFFIMMIK